MHLLLCAFSIAVRVSVRVRVALAVVRVLDRLQLSESRRSLPLQVTLVVLSRLGLCLRLESSSFGPVVGVIGGSGVNV